MPEHPLVAFIRGKLGGGEEPFVIAATLVAAPGRGNEVVAAIAQSKTIALSRAEDGCMAYQIGRDTDAPDRFVVHECWRDLAALERHLATPHFAAVGKSLEGLLAEPPEIQILRPLR